MRIRNVFFILFFALCCQLNSQTSCGSHHNTNEKKSLEFLPNNNQLHPNVEFEAGLGGLDKVFLEQRALTYVVYDDNAVENLHSVMQSRDKEVLDNYSISGHSYQVEFLNAQEPILSGGSKQAHHYNYFIGNDASKWASNVPVYHEVNYESLYPGIDLLTYSNQGYFKYDFVISAKADVDVLALVYEDVDNIRLDRNGDLIIKTAVKEIVEKAPLAYQFINGRRISVACNYRLENRTVTFEFPNGYDDNHPLVIDPVVIASTLTGTTISKNFGHTASYDNAGNIYLGGVSYGVGYPTVLGSFQSFFGGGKTDMAVCKFNPDGTQMIYATYIGGVDKDAPHSIIIDNNQQLCILGSTSSVNFPVTSNAFQKTIGGDSDIAVVKLSQDGSTLVGSTFIGGYNTDGLNTSKLYTNYGEEFRGEIILDNQGDMIIASNTTSSDFPVTPNAYQSNLTLDVGNPSKSQDGVVFKLNSDLSALFWSTYLGSNDADTAFGVRVNNAGEIYVTGTAGSPNFPTTNGTIQSVWPGGEESAYVAVLSSNGQQLLRSTFWGTDKNDHSYFLDLDEIGNVHIYGQTTGVMPISPGAYSFIPGSPQFISAFSSDLETLVYSTVIGDGPLNTNVPFPGISGKFDFVPAAFMVDKCNGIYFSGYYAQSGLPVTSDAINGSGSNVFYLGVLAPDASDLTYATYYGNATHVDGGTSRFDKGGVVYQAVCSCTNRILDTKPGAWAESQSVSCDMGVFKLDFEISSVTAKASFDQSASGCAPYTVDFHYTGQDGTSYFWDFENGNTSTDENPSNTFLDPGSYTVMLVAENLNSCNLRDTTFTQIDVLDGTSSSIDTSFCSGASPLFLDATTQNASYIWQDGSVGATFEASSAGVYWVDVSIVGCSRRDTFNVMSTNVGEVFLENDKVLCGDSNYLIEVSNPSFNTFLWNDNSSGQSLITSTSGTYSVTVTDEMGCEVKDEINISFNPEVVVDLGDDVYLCEGQSVNLESDITQGNFLWQDNSTDAQYNADTPGVYTLEVTIDGCKGYDEIEVLPTPGLTIDLGPDLMLCDQQSVTIDGTTAGAASYSWTGDHLDPIIEINSSGLYSLSVLDIYGCGFTDQIKIDFANSPKLDIKDTVLCEGATLSLDVTADSYLWTNGGIGSSITVFESGEYWIEARNQTCIARDTFEITVNPIPTIDLGSDKVACDGDHIELIAYYEGASYIWQDGSADEVFFVDMSGDYWVEIDKEGCKYRDTVEVVFNPVPIVDLGVNQVLCMGDSLTLDATVIGANYEWQDGTNNSIFVASGPGMYSVVVDLNGCTDTDLIEITPTVSLNVDLGENTQLCDISSFELDMENNLIQNYEWSTGETTPGINVTQDGIYWVELVDINGCIHSDSIELAFGESPIVNLKDTTLCIGEVVALDASYQGASYIWNDGSIKDKLLVNTAGKYWVEAEQQGCITKDTAYVDFAIIPEYVVNQTDVVCFSKCDGELNLTFISEDSNYDILWSNQHIESTISDLCVGQYDLELTDIYGCEYLDHFTITEPEELSYVLDMQDVECSGFMNGSIAINNVEGGVSPYQYSLNGSEFDNDSDFENLSGGSYFLEIEDMVGCIVQDTIELKEPKSLELDAGEDGYIERGESFQISASTSTENNIIVGWNTPDDFSCDECLDPIATPLITTTYELMVTDAVTGCVEMDEMVIYVDNDVKVYTPNIFSPNGDGSNDEFTIFSNATIAKVNYLRILDRWGGLVFEKNSFIPNNPDEGWDGTMGNTIVNPGVFVFIAELELYDGRKEIIKGDITLVR